MGLCHVSVEQSVMSLSIILAGDELRFNSSTLKSSTEYDDALGRLNPWYSHKTGSVTAAVAHQSSVSGT